MTISTLSKDDILFLARLSDKAARYDRMKDLMKQFIIEGYELTPTERQLFSVAFRDVISTKRSSWRALFAIKGDAIHDEGREAAVAEHLSDLSHDIETISKDVLGLISNHILPLCTNPESKVFFLKLQADYERYIAEVSTSAAHSRWASKSFESYKSAADLALCCLPPTHPTRLGLMLNFSIYYYEIDNSPERACVLARATYEDALEGGLLGKRLRGEEYDASLETLRCINSNLKRWTSQLSGSVDDRKPIKKGA